MTYQDIIAALSEPQGDKTTALNAVEDAWRLVVALKDPKNIAAQKAIVARHQQLRAERGKNKLDTQSEEAVLGGLIKPLMQLREIHSDASVKTLEALAKGERVHMVLPENFEALEKPAQQAAMAAGIEKLKRNRLAPSRPPEHGVYDKHAYGLFLPWEDVPITVVYTALTSPVKDRKGKIKDARLPGNIHEFVDREIGIIEKPTAITPYSVSNILDAQPRGMPLGYPLIRGVLDEAMQGQKTIIDAHALPTLLADGTLSPMTEFGAWLNARLEAKDESLFTRKEKEGLLKIASRLSGGMEVPEVTSDDTEVPKVIKAAKKLLKQGVLPSDCADHYVEKHVPELKFIQHLLRDVALEYLLTAKSRKNPVKALDEAGDTHWGFGAYLGDIKVGANTSPNGFKKYITVMANHVYDPAQMEANAHNYLTEGKIKASYRLQRQFELRQEEKRRDAEPTTEIEPVHSTRWRSLAQKSRTAGGPVHPGAA